MIHAMKTFARDDSGAVTVDWVVLTAAVILMALGVVGLNNQTRDLGTRIGSSLSNTTLPNY